MPIVNGIEHVLRSGKIFEIGDYPDKRFSLNEEEADRAIEDFSEVPLDLEHTPTVLDGKLGMLTALRRQGKDLIGDTLIPKWFDDVLGETERKVSATWDRVNKRINKLAVVLDPRVQDAALFSAYAEFTAATSSLPDPTLTEAAFVGQRNSSQDQSRIQAAHDLLNNVGAECRPQHVKGKSPTGATPAVGNSKTSSGVDAQPTQQFSLLPGQHYTPVGQAVIQQIHDSSTRGGAICKPPSAVHMASQHEASAIQQVHDITSGHGAVCHIVHPEHTSPAMYTKEGKKKMSLKEELLALFGRYPDEVVQAELSTTPTVAPAAVTPAPDSQAAFAAEQVRRENDSLKQENARMKLERIQEQAAAFARDVIEVQHRAFPVERDAIVDAYATAALDDLSYGPAAFSGGRSMTRVKALENAYASRPANQLTAETLPNALSQLATMSQTPRTNVEEKLNRDQIDELLKMTSLGASLSASRNGTQN